jgi:hypothetical protein
MNFSNIINPFIIFILIFYNTKKTTMTKNTIIADNELLTNIIDQNSLIFIPICTFCTRRFHVRQILIFFTKFDTSDLSKNLFVIGRNS